MLAILVFVSFYLIVCKVLLSGTQHILGLYHIYPSVHIY